MGTFLTLKFFDTVYIFMYIKISAELHFYLWSNINYKNVDFKSLLKN